MAKPAVYLETSVVSYATARMSRDLIVAARQQATREWFELGAMSYDLFASELVVAEASSGDVAAARQRLDLLDGVSLLSITDDVDRLARSLWTRGPCRGRRLKTQFTSQSPLCTGSTIS